MAHAHTNKVWGGCSRAKGERKREKNLAPPFFWCMYASTTYTRSRARMLWELKALDLDLDLDLD